MTTPLKPSHLAVIILTSSFFISAIISVFPLRYFLENTVGSRVRYLFEYDAESSAIAAPVPIVMESKRFFDRDDDDDPLISQLTGILDRIFDQDGDDPPLISRGNGFCVLAPALDNGETSEIWSDRPVLVWEAGSVGKLGLRQANSNSDFWSYVPTNEQTYVTYDGVSLQPGETYEVAIYLDDFAAEPTALPEFQVMGQGESGKEGRDRQSITAGLNTLTEPKPEGVSHIEWFAIQRANYFASNNLPLDAIQSLFNVTTPSVDLVTTQQAILKTACTPDD
ncbi:MAG: hypothetical protein AAGD25_25280 [Cyanobacteria bacterium P01_F01_bin.150]